MYKSEELSYLIASTLVWIFKNHKLVKWLFLHLFTELLNQDNSLIISVYADFPDHFYEQWVILSK